MILTTEFDEVTQEERSFFAVLHPPDDQPEMKVDTEHLRPMQMTTTVSVCLFSLCGLSAAHVRTPWVPSVTARRCDSRLSGKNSSKKGGHTYADENDPSAAHSGTLDSIGPRSAFADGCAVWAPHPMRADVIHDI
jgi:hypothetical protein